MALASETDYFLAQGGSLAHAQQQAFTWIAQQVQAQATFLAYIDVFWVLMLISAAMPERRWGIHSLQSNGGAARTAGR
jgi:DHA2 family multidrug resistance protein